MLVLALDQCDPCAPCPLHGYVKDSNCPVCNPSDSLQSILDDDETFRRWIKHKHGARDYDETEMLQIYRKCLDEFGGPIRIEPPHEGRDSVKEWHMHPDPKRPNIWIPISKEAYDLAQKLGL